MRASGRARVYDGLSKSLCALARTKANNASAAARSAFRLSHTWSSQCTCSKPEAERDELRQETILPAVNFGPSLLVVSRCLLLLLPTAHLARRLEEPTSPQRSLPLPRLQFLLMAFAVLILPPQTPRAALPNSDVAPGGGSLAGQL